MSAAKKLLKIEAYLETGTIARSPAPRGQGSDVEVRLSTGTFGAALAKSCLAVPEAGDKVLCAVDSDAVHVVAVLSGRAGAPTTLATNGDLRFTSKGRVSILGAEGVDIAGAGPVAIAAPEIHVRAQKGAVAVEELGFFGRLVQAEVGKVALLAREVDSVVTRLSQRAKRVFRFVEEIDQTRAGTVDLRAQGMLGLRAENALISARVLAKVDGEQIHLG